MGNSYVNDFSTTVKTYYEELKRYKPITRAKERELLKKAKEGDLKAQNDEITAFFKERGIEENEEELDDELSKLIDSVQKEEAKIDLPEANKEVIEEDNEEEKEKEKNKKVIELEAN